MVTQRTDLAGRVSMIPGAEGAAKEKGSLTDSFQSFFTCGNQVSNAGNKTSDTVTNLKSGYDQKGEYDKINSSYSKQADRVNQSRTERNAKVSDKGKDVSKEYSKKDVDSMKEEIYSVVEEATGLTEEEIDAVLEAMDITVFQLLQPEVLQEFLMTQTGTEPIDMLTNNELIMTLQDLNQGMQEILSSRELEVPDEELGSLIKDLENADLMDYSLTDAQIDTEGSMKEAVFDPLDENKAANEILKEQGMKAADALDSERISVEEPVIQDTVSSVSEQAEAVSHRRFSDESDKNANVTSEDQDQMITDTDQESGIQVSVRNADTKKEQNSSDMMQQNPNFAGDIVNQLSQAVSETESVTTSYTSALERQDIVRQVVEQIRVWNSGENSRMQVQLYPEHLGRIEIQVMLRNGTMTAQITAETELAKAAIESQLQALKESFEQKNMQVNAIEVNVGTPDFHDNEDRQDSMNQDSRTGSGRRHGGITGGFGADDEESIEETDPRLEAQGASVEFKA